MMENYSKKLIVNLITTPEELSKFFRAQIEEYLKQYNLPNKPPEEETEELHTVKQTALFFQVSETTIHAWKNSGIIPYIKIKSRIRFKKSEILKLYEKRRKK